MNDATKAWLILARTPGLEPTALRQLLTMHLGDPGAVVAALRHDPGRLRVPARQWLARPDETLLARDMAWLAEPGHRLLAYQDADFPPLIGHIPDAPAILFVAGHSDRLLLPQVAMIGARAATPAGMATARMLARDLGEAGFVVTSGLADGIDGAAHAAVLDASLPTVAVVGTGLDVVYPAKHRALAAGIEATGALVSEFPLGLKARPHHFPQRNRLISGLSLGTVVIEADLRSGSLITARLAAEQGREVFAVPGSIHNPLARGCHQLIRDGARLVESAQDVIEVLAPAVRELGLELRLRLRRDTVAAEANVGLEPDLDHACHGLLKALGYDPIGLDELVERTGLDASMLASQLLMLELEGLVQGLPGNRYQRLPVG